MPQDPVSDFLAQDATSLVRQKADEYGVPADFAERILNKETRKRADIITGRTRSPKGATGAMQLMPETAARLGVQDPTDYTQNIDGGVRELARLYKQYNGDQSLVAAGYNAGEGAVKKYGGKVPPYRETQDYVKEVASDPVQDFLKGQSPAPAPTPQAQMAKAPQKKQALAINPFDFTRTVSETLLEDSGKRETVATGQPRRPLPSPAPRKTPARFRGLRDMVDNEDGQALPQPSAEDRARAEFRQKPIPMQVYEEAKAIPGRLVTAMAAPLQRVKVVGEGLRNADPDPLIATAGELGAGAVKGFHDISKNTGKVLPESLGGYALRQILPTRADAQQVGAKAKTAYEEGAQKYSYDDPVLPTFNELRGRQLQEEHEASLRPGMPAGVTRAVGGALPAVAASAVGGLPAALTAQAAMGDVENPIETAVNMASVGVPMKLTAAARPALNAATKAMAAAPRTLARLGGEMAVGGAGNVGQELVTQPLLTGTIDPQRLVESGVVGSLFGINDVAQQGLANRRAAGRAPATPAAPRTVDTNLNPDEVLTPATGAQPIIDPVTGLPQAEVSNPATDAKVDDLFAGILGRKPNPAAEKAKVKAQEAQAYRQAAEESAAAGDVGRQMDALKEALQRETDPQVRLDIQAELRALEPAPATRKLSGQRASAEPALPTPPAFERAPETAALSDDVANAPTSDLPEVDPGQQALISAGERRAQAKTEKNYALAESIAAGELAGLQARQKQIDPNDVQQVIQFASAVRALQLEIKGLQKLQAEEAKAVAPARAPRAAVPKTPKGPKVVIPKAEGVRKGQGVLSGVAPDQIELIGNPLAEENQSGGIPPVEPVAGNVLPFEELAGREKAKVNKRANMSPVEYLKQASQGEGFRVTDSGEAEGVSAKDAKIVAFTNQNSQYGMNDAAIMLDEGGYFLPDGRRFTDQDVKESDVLDYLKQHGKQSSAGNTGGVDPRIAAEEAAYYEQRAASEGAPTTSTRLPSGLIAESRRPQPIETPRSTPDYRQKALDRINAAELPDNAKQRYRDWLEQGRLTDSDVLNDPDLAPVAQSTPAEQVQEVEMRRTGTDNAPVVEMPKRATPPQPIPEELSRVYGGKITPEQAEAIQRRAKNRASVEIGLGGKFGDMARKSFMSSGGTTELSPLVGHPALREALGLPEMPAYLVEDGRVSKLWQEAAQHALDGLAEWGGVERSSRAGDDGLGRIEDAIAERINDRTLYEAFGRTVVATDTAQKRLSAVLDRPEVKTAIEAAQAEIADQRARGLKSLALRKSGKALDEALRTASEQALKDFPADAIGSYGKDWSEITKSAIEEFRADIRAERLGPDGSPESWIGRRFRESIGKADGGQARESQAAQGDSEQPAASPAKSSTGRAPAPAQESPRLQAPTEIVEPTSDRKGLTVPEGANRIGQNADSISQSSEGQSMKQPGSQIYYHGERRIGDVKEGPKLGRFLTTERKIAEKYANNKGRVLAYEADVRSPLKVEGIDPVDPTIFTPEQMNAVMKKAGVRYKFPDNIDEQEFWRYIDDGGKRLVSAVKQAGYDALVFPDVQGARYFDTTLVFDEGKLRTAAEPQAPTEIVEPRVGGYVRKDGRIYEITKYHPKEGAVWIQEPGSPGAQAIPQSEVRKLTIPDDVAKAEIGEAAKGGQPSQNQPKTSGRKEKTPSQIEYRGSLLNPIKEIPKVIEGFKNLAATLSGRNPSKLYQLPADQGKLRAEIDDVVKIVKRYAKAREDAGLSIDPELAKSLSDSAQKIATAFQSGDQKGYQNARKAIDDAFVKYGVEAPSFASTRREALKAWEKYQKAQEAAGKPLSKEYAAALIDIEQRLRFANRDGDVQAYQKAKRDLNWLTQKIEAKEDPATLGDRLLTLRAAAHFLNPKFVIRNVLSQPIVWGGDKIDNAVAATISKLAAAVRGKKSVVGLDDFSTLKALIEGGKLSLQERGEGKSIDPLYGLHPHAFEGKAGRALEDALFFINRLPDDAFYHGYFTAKLNDLAQRYKGSKDVSLDQLINQAHLESNKLAMRDKNWVSESLKRMQHGLNRLSTFNKSEKVGLGTLIVNYPQYPGSALKRAMEHSPLGLIDVAIEASKPGPFRERNVINALSKTLTGSAFTFGMGTLLGASGILTQGLTDDRRDNRRLREIGYRPYQLNTSALSRWFNGGFQQQRYTDGDKLVSIDWAQPFAMLLAAGAATSYAWNREMSKTDKAKETGQAIYDSVASFMSTLGDQSVVKNLTHYKDTYDRAVEFKEDGIAATAQDIADDIVSSNVPVVLNQIRQWRDPVNRSTWAQEADEKGKLVRKEGLSGFLEETFIRRPQSRLPIVAEKGIPGVMRGLPAFPGSRKQTTYTPQPENNSFINAFVNPSNVSTVRPVDQSDRKLLDSLSQPRKKKEKKRKPIETVEPGK